MCLSHGSGRRRGDGNASDLAFFLKYSGMIVDNYKCFIYLQAISKMQIMFNDKARADEKAQHNTVIGH